MQIFTHRTGKLLVLLSLSGVGHIWPLLRSQGGAGGMADVLFLQVANSLIP